MDTEQNTPRPRIDEYLIEVVISEDVVSIRDTNYPLESFNSSGEGRFHKPGESAYYHGSGAEVARAEVLGDPEKEPEPPMDVFHMQQGPARLYDLARHVADQPEDGEAFFPAGHKGGWEVCQEFRGLLQDSGVSGVVYPSQKLDGGQNIAIWPLGGGAVSPGFYKKPDDADG